MELTNELFATLFLAAIYFFYPEEVDMSLKPRDVPQNELAQEYDFIIVGAGSAGCVVAHRLTEIPYWTVLLIEAGGDETAETDVPLNHFKLRHGYYDWNYTTVPQKRSCLADEGGMCEFPRGHIMGGSSTIHGMIYTRGHKVDYDDWEKLGNKGWNYDAVLPYFKKSEKAVEPDLKASPYHGTEGLLRVQYARFHSILRDVWIKAGEELGWENKDFNAPYSQNSIGINQLNLDGASRQSLSKAFLNPIRNRNNLFVIKNSFATKILFDKTHTRATGVEYVRDGIRYKKYARKEVICTAGAINTPKLLMLSGIGPKNELKKHGIKVILDLPVGHNLLDHVLVPMYFELEENVTVTSDVWKTKQAILEYSKYRKGPLSYTGMDTIAFVNPDSSTLPQSVSYLFTSFMFEYEEPQHKQIMVIFANLFDVKSVGTVKLKSKNPYDPPLIDPNYLDKQADYDLLTKCIKLAIKFTKTSAMKNCKPKLYLKFQPECLHENEEDTIKCLIAQYSTTEHHPVGTTKMGVDKSAVVTPKLMVKGIKNLRVADASIMPTIPRANTNAPTVMIAEKVCDIIKKRYNVLE